jgi:hypothetical protein
MTLSHESHDVGRLRLLQQPDTVSRHGGGGWTMTETIEHGDQRPMFEYADAEVIAAIAMTVGDHARGRPLDAYLIHD